MAEKASLMLEAAKKTEEIQRLQQEIARCNELIDSLPQNLEQEKCAAREKSLAAFNSRQNELEKRVEGILAKKRKEIEDYIDGLPGMGAKEYAGKLEVKDIEAQLMEVYPDALISNYICSDVPEVEEPEDAFALYQAAEHDVARLNGGSDISSKLFTGVTQLLVNIMDNPNLGAKAIPVVLLFYAASIFFFPFVFITAFSAIGALSALQGMSAKRLMSKLFGVKRFLNESYDEDVFADDKEKIMKGVDGFLHDVKVDYFNVIGENTFEYDDSNDRKLEKKTEGAVKKAKQDRDVYNSQLERAQEELSALHEKIGLLEEEERKRAESARKELLETITWKHEWLQHIFIDVTKDNKKVLLPFSKANSCYFSKSTEDLQGFSRITILQCMLHMHPEYASEVVLDYKYMGGQLTQFQTLEKGISISMSEEEISKKTSNIDNEIKARTKSILSSSPDLDSFNELMGQYGSTGEFYVVVHVFGLSSLSNNWKNWLRNGPRVGYIFKFYFTVEELEAIKDDLPFSDIKDFFEITNTAIPRSAAAVKRIIGMDS